MSKLWFLITSDVTHKRCRHETPRPHKNKPKSEDETQEVSAHKEDDTLKAQTSSSSHIQGAASVNRCLSQGIGNGS